MSSKTPAPKKGKGVGRKATSQAYRLDARREKNKKIKVARHQKKHPNDNTVVGTVPNYKDLTSG
jgi:hypothetical protein